MVYLSKFDLMRFPNLQKVRQMFLLQHSSGFAETSENWKTSLSQILSGKTDKSDH